MGAIWELKVGKFTILSGKYHVHPEILTIFREIDKSIIYTSSAEYQGYYDNIYCCKADTQSAPASEDNDDNQDREDFSVYACKVRDAIDRLNIMGYTMKSARRMFYYGENGVKDQIRTLKMCGQYDNDMRVFYVNNMKFENWLQLMRDVIKYNLHDFKSFNRNQEDIRDHHPRIFTILTATDHMETEFGYPNANIRNFIRTILSIFPAEERIYLNYTEQVHGGYYSLNQPLVEWALMVLSPNISNDRILVLTEGPTDIRILQDSMKLLYPHLWDYYYFLNLNPTQSITLGGGAEVLATQIKSLIGAGIRNRIIAIFDNDMEGWNSRRHLRDEEMPSNVKILMLPDLPLARSYPVLSKDDALPEVRDANRSGCAIEMYLGEELLRDGASFVPLHVSSTNWKLSPKHKAAIQCQYSNKISDCQSGARQLADFDWSAMRLILDAIFNLFQS